MGPTFLGKGNVSLAKSVWSSPIWTDDSSARPLGMRCFAEEVLKSFKVF